MSQFVKAVQHLSPKFFKSKKVLITDDCDPVRASIKGMLQKIGFEHIAQAPDANTAIANCTEVQYDFILSDFNLGEGKDGYQLFEALKHLKLLKPSCCFIIISAESHRQIVHGVIELQPDAYLLKPFSFVQLEKRLLRAFEIKHKLHKVYHELTSVDVSATSGPKFNKAVQILSVGIFVMYTIKREGNSLSSYSRVKLDYDNYGKLS